MELIQSIQDIESLHIAIFSIMTHGTTLNSDKKDTKSCLGIIFEAQSRPLTLANKFIIISLTCHNNNYLGRMKQARIRVEYWYFIYKVFPQIMITISQVDTRTCSLMLRLGISFLSLTLTRILNPILTSISVISTYPTNH